MSSLRFSTAIHSSVCGAGFAWLLGLGFGFAFAFPFALGIGLGLAAGLLRGISPRWDPFRGSLGLVSTFLLFELFCSARSPLRVLQKKGILPKKEKVHKLEELGFEVCLLWFVLCLFLLLHTWLPNRSCAAFHGFSFSVSSLLYTTAFATLAFALPGCLLPCSSGYLVVLSRPFWRRRRWRCVVVRCCLITLLFVRRSRGRPELKSRLCRMDRTVWARSTAMPQSRGPSFLT